jgi:hypothetical protein
LETNPSSHCAKFDKVGDFQKMSKGSETSDGFGTFFEGNFEDMCTKNGNGRMVRSDFFNAVV